MKNSHKRLPFTVVVPIPYRAQSGTRLSAKLRGAWEAKAIRLLTECFGGATPIDSQGEYRMADGTVSLESGQRAVIAACTRADFKRVRATIEDFAEEMMKALDQEAVCVLAFPGGESFLLS